MMNNVGCSEEKPLVLNTVDLPSGDRLIVREACLSDTEGLTKNIFTAQAVEDTINGIKAIREKGWLQVVGQIGDEIIGHILAMRQTGLFRHRVRLDEIVVAKDWRGRGIAKILVESLEPYFASKGVHLFLSSTSSDNKSMIRAFEKMGFQKWGILKGGFLGSDEVHFCKRIIEP